MLTITLDGAQLTVDPTQTLLQIAKQHQIDIPSLCGDNTNGPKTPCDLCVVEIAGLGIRRACETPPRGRNGDHQPKRCPARTPPAGARPHPLGPLR